MNGETFLTWVEGMLVRELLPGDIVVMDKLPAHKVAGVRDLIEGEGASLLYLPPYSPDFNPIEKAFSKRKALLKKGRSPNRPGPSHRPCQRHQCHNPNRMRQLLHRMRISTGVKRKCFRCPLTASGHLNIHKSARKGRANRTLTATTN